MLSNSGVMPLLLAAVGVTSMLVLVLVVAYACASENERQDVSTVGEVVSPNDEVELQKQQISDYQKQVALAEYNAQVKKQQDQDTEAKLKADADKKAEEARIEEQRQQKIRAAEAERIRQEEISKQQLEEKSSSTLEEFPDIESSAVVSGDSETGSSLDNVRTTRQLISSLSLSQNQHSKPERRLSALDSPYGKLLSSSPQTEGSTVAKLLWGAYPALGIKKLQQFVDEMGLELETDLGLVEEQDVMDLDPTKFDEETRKKLWLAVVSFFRVCCQIVATFCVSTNHYLVFARYAHSTSITPELPKKHILYGKVFQKKILAFLLPLTQTLLKPFLSGLSVSRSPSKPNLI